MKENEKIIKMYVKNENLNEEEKKHNRISYARLVDRVSNGIWLFNKAQELEQNFNFVLNSDYDEDTDEYVDIYQYYLININEYTIEDLHELGVKDLIIAWSETLEEYVLMVDHMGTHWDYVLTDIEPTEDYEKADL